MASRSDRHLIVLLSAVATADAREGLSPRKRRMMNLHLRRRFPHLSGSERQELVARALRGMPEISDGRDFIRLIERQSRKLAAQLPPEEHEEAMLTLLDVAVAGGAVTEPVQRVLFTAARELGFADRLPLAA